MRVFFYCIVVLSAVSSIMFIGGCAMDKSDEMGVPIIDTTCIPAGTTVTYTNDIKQILETKCTDPTFGSCHQSAGGSGFDYTNYAGIFAEATGGVNSTLYFKVFVIGDMPSNLSTVPLSLTDCEKQKLKSWIDNGAPE